MVKYTCYTKETYCFCKAKTQKQRDQCFSGLWCTCVCSHSLPAKCDWKWRLSSDLSETIPCWEFAETFWLFRRWKMVASWTAHTQVATRCPPWMGRRPLLSKCLALRLCPASPTPQPPDSTSDQPSRNNRATGHYWRPETVTDCTSLTHWDNTTIPSSTNLGLNLMFFMFWFGFFLTDV